jgi:hypothetical protein
MIWIKQLYVDDDIQSDYVKCPSCKKGRLCDKAVGEKATTICVDNPKNNASIILKCPKCGSKFLVSITPENE